MRILYITQYYPPEIGAGAFRAESIVKGLIKKGHNITVLSEFPCYPISRDFREYKKYLWQFEEYEGVPVHRVWVKTAKRMDFLNRLSYYISFSFTAALRGVLLGKNFDVVYATSPPLFVGFVGHIISAFYRVPLVFEVRDLWPEIAIEMGEIKNDTAIKLSLWLEAFLYKKSTKIITVTNGFKQKIISKEIRSNKIHSILNFVKPFKPVADNEIKDSILKLLDDGFVIIYAGLLGLFQGVDVIIEAAKQLKNIEAMKFIIIGGGVEEAKLKRMAETYHLTNVIWLKPQSNSLVGTLISRAGCSVIPLRNLPGLKVTIPSKLFDYMGYGSPIILSASGEVAEILKQAKAGIVVAPEDPTALSEAILRLYKDEKLCLKYRENTTNAVKKQFSMSAAIKQIDELLRSLIQAKKGDLE